MSPGLPPCEPTETPRLPLRLAVLIGGGLVAIVFAIFGQVVGHLFTLWDDPTYVSHNPQVLAGLTPSSVWWAFSEFWASNWHPITWLSHMLDAELWGSWAGGHHLSSVLLHAVTAVLLWLFLARTTGAFWRSALVAALFAVHPLHVESVAWVSERKDVLSAFFWVLTLLAYRQYIQRPALKAYLWVTLAFTGGLMAKPMLVTLPIILLFLDIWPFCRLEIAAVSHPRSLLRSPVVLEKLPWLLLSIASAVVTLYAQQAAIVPVETISGGERVAVIVIGYAAYLWKMIWPAQLSFFYELPADLRLTVLFAALTLGGLIVMLVWALRTGRRPVVVGILWYLVTLLPVIGVVKVGGQAYADRYSYLPLVGIFVALVWLPSNRWLGAHPGQRLLLAMLSVLAVLLLSGLSWRQAAHWRDSESLFAHALAIDPDNAVALVQYGEALIEKGDLARGEAAIRRALTLSDGAMVRFNGWIALGNAAFARREYGAAFRNYAAAGNLGTRSALPDYNLGTVLLTLGRAGEAREYFLRALRRHPRYVEAYANLGVAEERMGRIDAAREAYAEALRIDPKNNGARTNLERLLARMGNAQRR